MRNDKEINVPKGPMKDASEMCRQEPELNPMFPGYKDSLLEDKIKWINMFIEADHVQVRETQRILFRLDRKLNKAILINALLIMFTFVLIIALEYLC